ncbi:unnamed protein product [Allacma fusca]|uniref:Uncharacterized protein n=1 Tax=Allacma fusca TaxID=39272 RepID=A0A8J2KUQ9_9HEXA|nr:unnamed protein product [Allacma fusca]
MKLTFQPCQLGRRIISKITSLFDVISEDQIKRINCASSLFSDGRKITELIFRFFVNTQSKNQGLGLTTYCIYG